VAAVRPVTVIDCAVPAAVGAGSPLTAVAAPKFPAVMVAVE